MAKKFLKVKLFRGFIGLQKKVKDHAQCIGLTKRFQTVYIKPGPETVGNLLKIKELVKVELVDKIPPPLIGPLYPHGYTVTNSYLPHGQERLMPRSFRLGDASEEPIWSQMTNQELAQSNQKLHNRIQKLTTAYQSVEQQNVMLRDRCLRLQNRVDELKLHLGAIKNDVGQRVAPLRLIAGHLFEVASFMETLDNSIEDGQCHGAGTNVWALAADRHNDAKKTSGMESISEAAEVPETSNKE